MPLRDVLHRRSRAARHPVAVDLQAELDSPVPWMYPWRVTPEITPRIGSDELASVHATREEMIEPVVRKALASAGPEASVLDLGCNEGWFGHRALDWGAGRVVGIDIRDVNVRRARLVRDHFGISSERLRFERASVYDLDPEPLGRFDVVLVLGLIYHLEDPIGALRIARSLARGTVVVESQLTAQHEAIRVGWGETGVFKEAPSHWAAVLEPAEEQTDDGNLLSSFGGVISLVPNRAALVQSMEVIGLRDVRMLDAAAHLNRQYVDGHRGIAVGHD